MDEEGKFWAVALIISSVLVTSCTGFLINKSAEVDKKYIEAGYTKKAIPDRFVTQWVKEVN